MVSIKDICSYIISNYPHKDELSNARLTKMVYLSDWLNSLKNGEQLTNINWYYDNYGPFVWEIYNSIVEHEDLFSIKITNNLYGSEKRLVTLKKVPEINIEENQRRIIDSIIEKTQKLYWNDFIKLVYSTYPILGSEKYTHLNLVEKALEFNRLKEKRRTRRLRWTGQSRAAF